jgi:ATP-dependent DNA helicase RecQ
VGAAKLQKYGDAFLEALADGDAPPLADPWAATGSDDPGPLFAGATSEPEPAAPDPLAALDTEGLDSVEVTRELVLQGYRPEAVASMRGLKVRTVEDHLAELVRRGDLTAEEATGLPGDEVRRIQEVAEAVAEEAPGKLRPVFDALGGEVPYAVLKCVLAAR